MANIYITDANNVPICTTVGYLKDSGSTFPVVYEPTRVTKFTAGNPTGIELTKNTSTPTQPGSGKWGYSGGYVYLGDPLSPGQIVIATRGDVKIFEGVPTLANTAYFDVGQSDANYRTKQQKLFLWWVGGGQELRDVQISAEDFLSGEGSSAEHYAFAPDNNGSPGQWVSTLTSQQIPALAALKDCQKVPFWVRCIKPQGSSTGIFSDVNIKIQGYRYQYVRGTLYITGDTSIELPYNHYYLAVYAVYEGITTGRPPIVYWNASTNKAYLQVGGGSGYVHYLVCPLDPNNVSVTSFSNTSYTPSLKATGYNTITVVVTSPVWGSDFENYQLQLTASASGYVIMAVSPQDVDVFGEEDFEVSESVVAVFSLYNSQYMLFAPMSTANDAPRYVYFPYVSSWGSSAQVRRSSASNTSYAFFRGIVVQ